MRRCDNCGEWIDKNLLFCPICRLPAVRVEPTSHRPAAIFAFGVVLVAVAVLVVLVIRHFVS